MRGKLSKTLLLIVANRITPACAGKTVIGKLQPHPVEDHPRVCGENPEAMLSGSLRIGSPPRVRGKRGYFSILCNPIRITPACAGKTCVAVESLSSGKDHPRVCGENGIGGQILEARPGSPPRVRGKHIVDKLPTVYKRITPACAGKTSRRPV